ncbi:FAD binding domain-containing protein [Arthrobacter sp. 3Tela_A]|uniref:FAD binding domain-containing protein n=1 Tax=Arthrobacter sp. 3Tela_A TaxID=3093743 RepID=UPI003BB55EC7
MDLNTVEDLVPTADPADYRPGDAWLAGGTVLFSNGSSTLRRLLDLSSAGWEPLAARKDGLEIAATCTIAQLYGFASAPPTAAADWPALDLIQPCCNAFVASRKVWNVSTVGGNLCTALPAGPMTALTAALDGQALLFSPDGTRRTLPVTELVTGDSETSLAPGELLRSITLPASALSSRSSLRRQSLTSLGRSAVLLIGRTDPSGLFVLTVTAATVRPVQLRFDRVPSAPELRAALDAAIPSSLYHEDVHGLPEWRRFMTEQLSEEIRFELAGDPGEGTP